MNLLGYLNKSFGTFDFRGISIEPRYWQAITIVVLIFILILLLANIRHHFVDWSFRPALSMLVIGFLLAVVIEGFLLIGGKTVLTQILGWRSAPKPISTFLDEGRSRLINVLGVTDQTSDLDDIKRSIDNLDPEEADDLKRYMCE